jgi:microcystin-dependent protein
MKTIRTLLWVGLLALSVTVLATQAAEARKLTQSERSDISVFAYDFCPVGWLPADGRQLSIASSEFLFEAIGTRYGGDGQTTFALPQLDCGNLKCCVTTDNGLQLGIGTFLGEIEVMALQFCPVGWLPADGRELPVQTNAALFSLLVFRYGGDTVRQTTFALPKLDCGDLKCCINNSGRYPERP